MNFSPLAERPDQRLGGTTITLGDGHSAALASSDRVYLVCPQRGVASATVANNSYLLHPSHVFLLPAQQPCELRSSGSLLQLVGIPRAAYRLVEPRARVLPASDLLRSLMNEVLGAETAARDATYTDAVVSLLVCETSLPAKAPDQAAIAIAMPRERRLLDICQELLNSPGLPDNIDEWCSKAGMCRRKFTRTFKQETDMTFADWRREVRLVTARSYIEGGEQVSAAAYRVGYENVCAFTVAFSRRFGAPPCSYKPRSHQLSSLSVPRPALTRAQPCV